MSDRRVALVTGAAGGIGKATVRAFLARGYAVAMLDSDQVALARAVAELASSPGETFELCGDLTDLAFSEMAVRQTVQRLGRIDALVNNAAWREVATMREISLESWERTLRICLTAPAFLARWCAADMETRRKGVIVNVTSIMSQQSGGYSPSYIAAKGGLDALTHELASLYGPRGIRAVAVSPGAIDTHMSNDVAAKESNAEQELRAYSETIIPLGRWGTADEIARAIAWVASDEASYLTGTTLVLDGGWMRHHVPTNLAEELKPGQFS